MLGRSERFRRKWPSLYAAVEDGQIDPQALCALLVAQLPRQGICIFPLDGSPWPRPRGRVLADLQYVYQASSDVNGGTVTIGYPYSSLEWCAEPHSGWSLPVDVRRIPSQKTAQDVGAAQVQELARLRADCPDALDIVPADGKYGNSGFLQQVQGLRTPVSPACGVTECCIVPRRPLLCPGGGAHASRGGVSTSKTLLPGGSPMKSWSSTLRPGTPGTLEWPARAESAGAGLRRGARQRSFV